MKSIVEKLNVRFALFAVLAVVTLAAPLSIVWKYENTLRHGTLFKFRTKPVDPVDVFRGRYVTLSFAEDFVAARHTEKKPEHSRSGLMYVRLATDAEGFAKPVEITPWRLEGDDVITVDSAWWGYGRDGWMFRYPFDRYYLPEDVAPMAEQLYREANRGARSRDSNAKADTYVAVRVRNGVGVIEELYLNDVPVREAVRAKMQEQARQKVDDVR